MISFSVAPIFSYIAFFFLQGPPVEARIHTVALAGCVECFVGLESCLGEQEGPLSGLVIYFLQKSRFFSYRGE